MYAQQGNWYNYFLSCHEILSKLSLLRISWLGLYNVSDGVTKSAEKGAHLQKGVKC